MHRKYVALIDCIVIYFTRPDRTNILLYPAYSRHSPKHTLKYESITLPDEVFIHLYSLEVRRRYDVFLNALSRVEKISASIVNVNDQHYVVPEN